MNVAAARRPAPHAARTRSIGPVLVVAAAVGPPVLAFALLLGITVAERTGGSLFKAVAPANIAEAAAAGRGDDVVRRLRAGERLDRLYAVRAEATHSPLTRATPAEAAVWSRQLLMVELVDREGGIPAADRPALACLAVRLDLRDIADYLAPGGAGPCE